ERLILRDNDGRRHHRSDSSQRLERAARSSNGFALLLTGCRSSSPFLSIGPADDEEGSAVASEMAGLARFPAATHTPITECCIVPAPRSDQTPRVRSVYLV